MTVSPLLGDDAAARRALERRAAQVCVVYPDHPMPAGVRPRTARLGVEIDPATRRTRLLVDRGVRYDGPDARLSRWCADGELEFGSLTEAGTWLRTVGPSTHDDRARSAAVAAVVDRGRSDAVPVLSADDLAAALRAEVHGQEQALDRLAAGVARHTARTAPQRPETFLLVGPTGVGKTRTAERLATALRALGEERYTWLRLDMNEYRERHRVSRLLGAPPGYLGYDDGAPLVDRLRANPRSVVLFDEIDKAHPDVLVVLMNLMDRGRLTGGRADADEVDARHAVLLFTSNRCPDELVGIPAGAPWPEVDRACRRALTGSGVAPELVGRVGTTVLFRPLDDRALAEIAYSAIVRTGREYGLHVRTVDPDALGRVLEDHRTAPLGARPVEYTVAESFGDAFARLAARTGTSTEVHCGHDGRSFTAVVDRYDTGPGNEVTT